MEDLRLNPIRTFLKSMRWLAPVVLFAALSMVGCNKLKLGYEYADWLVIYSVEDNFDLDKAQRAHLKEDVADYFRWHRKDMLPVYATMLEWVADSLKTGLRMGEIDTGYARYLDLRKRTLAPVVDKAVGLLRSLTPEEMDAWLEKQNKKNQKIARDFSGGDDEKYDRRAEKIIDELEDWTGRLAPVQKEKIKVLSRTLPWNGQLWLETRQKGVQILLEKLRRHAPENELREYVSAYYLDPDIFRSPEYRTRLKEYDVRMKSMILVIHNFLTPDQRKRFIAEVEKVAHDFRSLSIQEAK